MIASETARLIIDGKTYEFPVIIGTEGERAIDISQLRQQTGFITYDPGLANSGTCKSSITFMDGESDVIHGFYRRDVAARQQAGEQTRLDGEEFT